MICWLPLLNVAAAQQPPPQTLVRPPTPVAPAEPWSPPLSPEELGPDPERDLLEISRGGALILTLPQAPLAVSVTRPDVATATATAIPEVLLIQGRQLGTTDMIVVFPGGRLQAWDISVARDLGPLKRTLEQISGR